MLFFKDDQANATDSSNSTDKNNATTTKQEKKPKIETLKEEINKDETSLDLQNLVGSAFDVAKKR